MVVGDLVDLSLPVRSDSWRPHAAAARLLCPWNFAGKHTGVGCHVLLQGILPTQGSNPGLLHCRQTLYCLSHQGSPGPPKSRLQRDRRSKMSGKKMYRVDGFYRKEYKGKLLVEARPRAKLWGMSRI